MERMYLIVTENEFGNPEGNELDLGNKLPDDVFAWLKDNPIDYKMIFRGNDDETAFELIASKPMTIQFYLSAIREIKDPADSARIIYTRDPYHTSL